MKMANTEVWFSSTDEKIWFNPWDISIDSFVFVNVKIICYFLFDIQVWLLLFSENLTWSSFEDENEMQNLFIRMRIVNHNKMITMIFRVFSGK